MSTIKIVGWVASLLVAGASIATPLIINLNSEENPSPIEPIEVVDLGIEPEVATVEMEETPASTETPAEQPTEIPTVTFTPAPATPTPERDYHAESVWSDITGLTSTDDYIRRYAGTCPSEQPRESIFWDMQRFLAFAEHYNHKWPTPIYYADVYWSWHMIDPSYSGKLGIANFASLGFDNHYANSQIGLWIDYDTMTIYWDKMYKGGQFTPTTPLDYWDTVAQETTTYLRDLNARYNAQCGV